jgi:hypothetical protein
MLLGALRSRRKLGLELLSSSSSSSVSSIIAAITWPKILFKRTLPRLIILSIWMGNLISKTHPRKPLCKLRLQMIVLFVFINRMDHHSSTLVRLVMVLLLVPVVSILALHIIILPLQIPHLALLPVLSFLFLPFLLLLIVNIKDSTIIVE